MKSRSISRELALLVLAQISEEQIKVAKPLSLENLIFKALESLNDHWREDLDNCAEKLAQAQQDFLDSELKDVDKVSNKRVRTHLKDCFYLLEHVLNGLSENLELPRLLTFSNDLEVQRIALERANLVVNKMEVIDEKLNSVMEGWRLHRLPKIDRDILRLAVVDLIDFNTPTAVTCNEAVNLANRYSDEQGRRMINGVLRKLQNSTFKLH